ncbi:gephyrin-like molybdotransferase Glp [Microvirga flavescens]|uniref:molybdopterin molybdotransferase MoeA n=1 Tax=Microvirga flavescens TaxID=2249811 RepID=UPI000DD7EA29|nr:gephyrin-like molybdotransferase Glp [Microvirga flavescens]
MSLIPVEDALSRVLAGIARPVEAERIPLGQCAERTLAEDVKAERDQPPFPASAMDGYAVRSIDTASIPATLRVIGVSAAGARFEREVGPGEAVRIFTGAPLPQGADAVVLQEDTDRDGDIVTVKEAAREGRHIRAAGLDFRAGETLLTSGQRLDARHISLSAAMGRGSLLVRRKPRIAILATGDELVLPGEPAGPDQITASSLPAIAAMVTKAGGEPIDLGIARDSLEALNERLDAAKSVKADMLVTLGGASVGEHDLVQKALIARGMALDFWRVALRPGKPLMHGIFEGATMLGLPGNPVSSFVCAILFVVPAIRALLGDPRSAADPTEPAILGEDLPQNALRQDYMRAALAFERLEGERPVVRPHPVQDSSMLCQLAQSDVLLIRPPHAPAARAGDPCRIIRLERFC